MLFKFGEIKSYIFLLCMMFKNGMIWADLSNFHKEISLQIFF